MKLILDFKNKLNKKKTIFSLPQTNNYQKISDLKISFANYQIIKEKEWGNEIVIFTFNDVEKEAKIIFNLKCKQNQQNIDKNLLLDNYKGRKFKTIDNRFINGNDETIKKLASQIVYQEKHLKKIIEKLYYFTLNYLTYGKPTKGLYSYRQALDEKITDCGGFASFLASLLHSLNIPTRLVVGFFLKNDLMTKLFSNFDFYILNFNSLKMHAWLEALLPDNSWLPLDPSIEWRRNKGLTKRKGGFGFIPDDRLVVSFGCDFRMKINGKIYQIDLIQNPVYI